MLQTTFIHILEIKPSIICCHNERKNSNSLIVYIYRIVLHTDSYNRMYSSKVGKKYYLLGIKEARPFNKMFFFLLIIVSFCGPLGANHPPQFHITLQQIWDIITVKESATDQTSTKILYSGGKMTVTKKNKLFTMTVLC